MSKTITRTPEKTEVLGECLAALLQPGDIVVLEGDLAAGKTTFVRGIVRALAGDPADVSSPTFVLVQSYPCRARQIRAVHHVDLYRLTDRDPRALRETGITDLLDETDAIGTIEWPRSELVDQFGTNRRVWHVVITILEDGARSITIGPPAP